MFKTISKKAKHIGIIALIIIGAIIAFGSLDGYIKDSINKHNTFNNPKESPIAITTDTYIHNWGSTTPVTTLKPGQVYWVHAHTIRYVPCDVTHTSELILDNDKTDNYTVLVSYYYSIQTFYQAGNSEFDEAFVLPSYAPPGHYHHVRNSVNKCGNQIFFYKNIDVEFDIK